MYRVWNSQRARREADLDVVAVVLHGIRSMIDSKANLKKIRKALPSWPSLEDRLNG